MIRPGRAGARTVNGANVRVCSCRRRLSRRTARQGSRRLKPALYRSGLAIVNNFGVDDLRRPACAGIMLLLRGAGPGLLERGRSAT